MPEISPDGEALGRFPAEGLLDLRKTGQAPTCSQALPFFQADYQDKSDDVRKLKNWPVIASQSQIGPRMKPKSNTPFPGSSIGSIATA